MKQLIFLAIFIFVFGVGCSSSTSSTPNHESLSLSTSTPFSVASVTPTYKTKEPELITTINPVTTSPSVSPTTSPVTASTSTPIPTATTLKIPPDLLFGGSVAFVSNSENRSYSIGLITKSGEMLFLTDDTGNDYSPKWSPDGGQIAFLSDRDLPVSSDDRDLWIVEITTGEVTPLTAKGD